MNGGVNPLVFNAGTKCRRPPLHFPAGLQQGKNLNVNSWEKGLIPKPIRNLHKREKGLTFPKIETGLLSRVSSILLTMLNEIIINVGEHQVLLVIQSLDKTEDPAQ